MVAEEVEVTPVELTLEEKVDKFLELDANGDSEAAEQQMKEIFEEHGSETDVYIMFANIALEMGKPAEAQDMLFIGYQETEDDALVDAYIDISLEYAEGGNGETYKTLLDYAEMIAGLTDNSDKLDILKQMYVSSLVN